MEFRGWTSTNSKAEFLQLLAQRQAQRGEQEWESHQNVRVGTEPLLGFIQSGTWICGCFIPTTLVWLLSIHALKKQVQLGLLLPSWNIANNIT